MQLASNSLPLQCENGLNSLLRSRQINYFITFTLKLFGYVMQLASNSLPLQCENGLNSLLRSRQINYFISFTLEFILICYAMNQ